MGEKRGHADEGTRLELDRVGAEVSVRFPFEHVNQGRSGSRVSQEFLPRRKAEQRDVLAFIFMKNAAGNSLFGDFTLSPSYAQIPGLPSYV